MLAWKFRGVLVATVIVLALQSLPQTAIAEVGLSLPPVVHEPARGFRFGEFVLIPSIGVEGRYNTNLFRQDPSEGNTAATILSIKPGFRLSNPEPSIVKLSWDADVGVNLYFSEDKNAQNQGRFGVDTSLRADFLPRSVFGFFVLDNFVRQVQSRNHSDSMTYDRNFNHAEAGIQIRPGAAMQIAASYAFNIDVFDEFARGDMMYHEARLLATWDIFPKTTVLLDGNFRVTDWANPQTGFRTDSMPLRVQAGLRGFITKKFAMTVKAGFGKGFYAEGDDIQTFIGEVSFGFKPTPFTLIDFGYDRDFVDSYYARYYVGDSAHLKVGQQLFQRLNLEAEGRYTYVQYGAYDPGTAFTASHSERRDHAITAKAGLSLSIIRYLSLRVGYQFQGILTDFRIDAVNAQGVPYFDLGGYKTHQVFGELSVLY